MSPKQKKEDDKVLKSEELLGGGGFLSGLGFSDPEAATTPKKEDVSSVASVEDVVLKAKGDEPVYVQPASFERQDMRPRNPRPQHGGHQRPAGNNSQSRPGGGYQGSHPRPGGNSQAKPGGYQGSHPRPGGNNQSRPGGGYQGSNPRPGGNYSRPHTPVAPKSAPTPAARQPKEAKTSQTLVKKGTIMMGDMISLKEFSEKMGVSHLEVMKKLLENKIMVGINSSLDFDTVTLIATDFGVDVKREQKQLNLESFMSGDLQAILDLDKKAEKTELRAPIVTVMGHVDHGKTSLLDYLRKTNIAGGEAGGITQSIGASVVHHAGRDITFIDTPGHALFTTLRARGSKITNVAIIVVAADDGLMPQTRESIEHAKAAGVPIIIAVTKIDKAQANMEKIKSDIGAFGLIPEDWGGDVPVLGVSSVTGQGIPELLDAVLLQAEMLDLRFDPRRSAVGVVLDAHKDQKQGVISSIILLTGTLKMTDIIVAYNTYGKVKRMQNWKGQAIKEAKGGDPIQILGLSELPEAGRIVEIVKNEREAQQKVMDIQAQDSENKKSSLETFLMELQTGDTTELKLILRSEGGSSLEALKQAIDAIELPKNVGVKVISADVGQFTESDLSLAQASKALLLGFDVHVPSIFKKRAEQHQVEVKSFDIIYELTDFLTLLLQGMIKKEYEEVLTGKLNVLGVFFRKGKEMILGGKCIEGSIKNGAKLKVFRKIDGSNEEEEIANGEITSLQRDKNNVKEVAQGHECGMKVRVQKKIELGDVLYFYDMQEKKETKESKEVKEEVKESKEEAK